MHKGLEKGAAIGIFSPSYPITAEAVNAVTRAESFIKSKGYHIKRGRQWGKADAFRSGTAKERADEVNELLYDSDVDCLMASFGGCVTNGILPYIDYDYFAKNPKLVVGMSDTTALLLALYEKTRIPVYYGTNFVTSFARLSPYRDIAFQCLCDVVGFKDKYVYSAPEYYSDEIVDWWNKDLLSEKQMPNRIITVRAGKTTGRLIGGNLSTLAVIWGTPYMPEIKKGDILFLEDTEAWAGDVERYITWLKLCGVFNLISGLIIGKFRAFDDAGTKKKSYEIIMEALGEVNFPIIAETDFSHCAPMLSIPIGITGELDANAQTLTLLR